MHPTLPSLRFHGLFLYADNLFTFTESVYKFFLAGEEIFGQSARVIGTLWTAQVELGAGRRHGVQMVLDDVTERLLVKLYNKLKS